MFDLGLSAAPMVDTAIPELEVLERQLLGHAGSKALTTSRTQVSQFVRCCDCPNDCCVCSCPGAETLQVQVSPYGSMASTGREKVRAASTAPDACLPLMLACLLASAASAAHCLYSFRPVAAGGQNCATTSRRLGLLVPRRARWSNIASMSRKVLRACLLLCEVAYCCQSS